MAEDNNAIEQEKADQEPELNDLEATEAEDVKGGATRKIDYNRT